MPQDKEVFTPAEAFQRSTALFQNLTGKTSPDIVLFASCLWYAAPEGCPDHPQPPRQPASVTLLSMILTPGLALAVPRSQLTRPRFNPRSECIRTVLGRSSVLSRSLAGQPYHVG